MATARIPNPTRDFESLTDDEMYARARASDASYNGRFFIGVLTTGIYCLPSCHARKPFRRNVRFFPDVESARASGLRACKKCFPDDFARGMDPVMDEIDALAAEVRAEPASFPDVASLVKRSGYGTTRLYQLFGLRYNLTPAEFLIETKLAFARRMLDETDVPVTDVAFAAGFASLTAFHQNFKRITGQTPAAYRRACSQKPALAAIP
jgi:AraC family transcriptional regulator of adaptative response / DNA-3-methyladenine glycosylase II